MQFILGRKITLRQMGTFSYCPHLRARDIPSHLRSDFVYYLKGLREGRDPLRKFRLSCGRPTRVSNGISVRMGGLIHQFNSFATISGASFRIRRKRVFKLLKPGNTNGSAAFGVLYKLLPTDDNRLSITKMGLQATQTTTQTGIKCITRGFSLCNVLAIQRGLRFFNNTCKLPQRGVEREVGRILSRFNLDNTRSEVTNSLPNKCGRHLSVTTTLLRRPGVLFLSRPADNVSPPTQQVF